MLLKVPIKQAGLLAREPRYNLRWSKFNAARASAEGPMIHGSHDPLVHGAGEGI